MGHLPTLIIVARVEAVDQYLEPVLEVVHGVLALPELHHHPPALILDGLHLHPQHGLVVGNLGLPLLDGDLQLGLPVLHAEQLLATVAQQSVQPVDLQLQHVVGDHQPLLLLGELSQLRLAGLVLQRQFEDDVALPVPFHRFVVDSDLALAGVVKDTLHLQVQHLVLLRQVVQHGLEHVDLLLQLNLLLFRALPLGSVDLPLHLLHLELNVVQQLLLLESLLVQLGDVAKHVLVLCLRPRDLCQVVGFDPADIEELLRADVLVLLQLLNLLVKVLAGALGLRQHFVYQLALLLQVPSHLNLLLELIRGLFGGHFHLVEVLLLLLQVRHHRRLLCLLLVQLQRGLAQRVLHHLQLVVQLPKVLRDQEVVVAILGQDPLLLRNLVLNLLVVLHLNVEERCAVLQLLGPLDLPGLAFSKLLPGNLDGLISAVHGLDGLLPLPD
mmetsp:Transcript_147240/g.257219  ORF Transcript_147240/g.257219 Transcript_147240/m.257219 type:complete len:440 (+) Transcript_147240:1685-3004(+)